MLIQLPHHDLTEFIIGKGMVVHDYFGPGMFEPVYKRCLGMLLVEAGLIVEIEKPLPVRFKGLSIECGYRVDLFVENKVVVEVKAVETVAPIHTAQMLTYLRLAERPVGLLLNFNVPNLRQGIHRVVNKRCLEEWQNVSAYRQSGSKD
jgi:GxxExxY protein